MTSFQYRDGRVLGPAEQVLQQVPMAVALATGDGTIVYKNDLWDAWLGGTLGTAETVSQILASLYPDPDYRRERLETYLGKRNEPGGQPSLVFTVLDAEGSLRDVAWSHARLADGRLLLTASDATDRLQAERAARVSRERFRAVFEKARYGIALFEWEGRLLHTCNDAFRHLLGYSDRGLDRLTVEDVLPAEEVERHFGDGTSLSRAVPVKTGDGRRLFCDISSAPASIAGRKHLVAEFHDVTERQDSQEALKRSEERLRQTLKLESIGQLAGGVAHDFNNLLVVIQGYGELVLGKLDGSDPLRRSIAAILSASEHASNLTRQLLAFSRKQVLQARPLDLNAVVTGVEKMIRRLISENIELDIRSSPEPLRILADQGQLEQVLLNLAANARDAMPEGGRLLVEASPRAGGPDTSAAPVRLMVSDTGVGMDRETRDRIFEPFFTTKLDGRGTGLGLSTVYGIVKQSGGSIRVESAPGQGTTFVIELPALAGEVEPVADELTAGPSEPRGGETVLLVEDDVSVREVLCARLRELGYQVLDAANPRQALEVTERHGPIDLLLTDVIMPQMSGPELAEQLLVQRPRLEVLYMSGYIDNPVLVQKVLEPKRAFIQKPFGLAALSSKVRQVLDGRA